MNPAFALLRAFACANWTCHTVVSPFNYHTIQIGVGVDPDQVSLQKLYSWIQGPQSLTRLQYVKCLVIFKTQSEADSSPSNSSSNSPP
jgi:hypothetical protein